MQTVYLIGVDGSNCCGRAVDYVKERATENSGKVLVAHVIEWSPFTFSTPAENETRHLRREQELERAREQVVGPVVKQLQDAGVDAEGLVAHGHVGQTLVRLGRKHEVTCLVIGRKGASRLAQLFGSVANQVVQLVDRPVIVVP